MVIAAAACRDHVAPAVLTAVRKRRYVIASQKTFGEIAATIHAQVLVAAKQLPIGERWHHVVDGELSCPTLYSDNGTDGDTGTQSGNSIGAALEGEILFTRAPGDHFPRFQQYRTVPGDPAHRLAGDVQSQY